jgi:hypothetical protein
VPEALLRQIEDAIVKQRTVVGSCNDVPATHLAYFNTGGCRFRDGDITAIEIEDGDLRLVRWKTLAGEQEAAPYRTVLEQAPLEYLFPSLG